jgi:Pyruvate/2-oxoacid:ferredoxin oxidoreductase delta subunit
MKVEIDMKKCIYCGVCRIACPEKAIVLRRGKMTIVAGQCSGCGLCVYKCWRGAIRMR